MTNESTIPIEKVVESANKQLLLRGSKFTVRAVGTERPALLTEPNNRFVRELPKGGTIERSEVGATLRSVSQYAAATSKRKVTF